MLSASLITYFSVTYQSISVAFFITFLFREACAHFDVKSKRFERVISAWWQLKALLKLFTMVTDFLMLLSLICAENTKRLA